ncbi:MAG TPA: hypothetical protein VNA25_30920 [Phycisphaerae bacterium]|nr:hypothetical protein [Phycisphaerae bacterium]
MVLQMILTILLWAVVASLTVFGLFSLTSVVLALGPRWWLRSDRGGDPAKGLAVWVEPIASPGLRWGKRIAAAGLRRAGFEGEFVFWSWHSRLAGLLVLPALMNRGNIERQAQRLAEFIVERRRERPGAPIYMLGYSCGGFVALRAIELLPEGASVTSAALLASAFSPTRDLTPALGRVEGALVVSASLMDWPVCGLGTTVFGCGDRTFGPAVGMLGVRATRHPKLVEIHWRPRMIFEGLLGLHEWGLRPGFIARRVAPAMGIGQASTAGAVV